MASKAPVRFGLVALRMAVTQSAATTVKAMIPIHRVIGVGEKMRFEMEKFNILMIKIYCLGAALDCRQRIASVIRKISMATRKARHISRANESDCP